MHVNRDYEPAAIARDAQVACRLASAEFLSFKNQVIFEKNEILTLGRTPFSVFTPYKNAWPRALTPDNCSPYAIEPFLDHLACDEVKPSVSTLTSLGFEPTDLASLRLPLGMRGAQTLFRDFIERIDAYGDTRDFPAVKGPSYLYAHLRFGTISIRQLVAYAHAQPGRGAQTWLSELIWRDFYHAILWHHPQVVTHCFKPRYDSLCWDEAPDLLAAITLPRSSTTRSRANARLRASKAY